MNFLIVGYKRIVTGIFIILSLVFLLNCGGGSGGSSGGDSSDDDTSLNGSLSGKVSSDVQESDVSGSLAAKPIFLLNNKINYPDMPGAGVLQGIYSAGTCTNSNYTVKVIGQGSTTYSSGTTNNIGEFRNIKVPIDQEVVVTFSCGTAVGGMRCFGRGGTGDLLCDPLAHAIVIAMEEALGLGITDPLFDGVRVSVMSAGLAEGLKLLWFNPILGINTVVSDNLNTAIAADDRTEIYNIILGSPLGAYFTALETVASEIRLRNQGQTDDEAAANTWTIANVFNYIVSLGIEIVITPDETSDGPGLYNALMDELDTMTGTTYHVDLRTYLGELYNTLYVNQAGDPVNMVCVARNRHDWQAKQLEYPPDANDGGTPGIFKDDVLTCIPANSNMAGLVQKGQCVNEAITTSGACLGGMTWDASNNACYDAAENTQALCIANQPTFQWNPDYDVYLALRPSLLEANRNDPTGLNIQDNDLNQIQMRSLEIYPEVESALGFDGSTNADNPVGLKCVGYMNPDYTLNAPPVDCDPAILGKYFAGTLGLYKFFRNTAIRDYKFSLNDMYDAFVGSNYMSIRFDASLWDINKGQGVDLTSSDNSDRVTFPRWQLIDNGDGTLSMNCPFGVDDSANTICTDTVNWSNIITDTTVNLTTTINAMMATTVPTFASTFQDFTQIPTISEIKTGVFESAHHEPWNIAGPEYYSVKGNSPVGTPYNATLPILCNIILPSSTGEFIIGTSRIACIEAAGTWVNGKPDAGTYNAYKTYFALQERGVSDNGIDTFYALMSIATGQDMRVNGREFRVRGIKATGNADMTYYMSGNDTTNDTNIIADPTPLDGMTNYQVDAQFCTQFTDENGNVSNNCWRELFDYVLVPMPVAWYPAAEYIPYHWDIPVGYGNYSVAISNNGTVNDYADDFPLCIEWDMDGSGAYNSPYSGILFLSNPYYIASVKLGADSVVNCYQVSTPYYYYLSLQWGQSVARGSYLYKLIFMDGTPAQTHPVVSMGGNDGWCSDLSYNPKPAYQNNMWGCINDVSFGPVNRYRTSTLTLTDMENADPGPIGGTPPPTVYWGAGTNTMGPPAAVTRLNGYQIGNHNHDPKYDPYCAVTSLALCDTNSDGEYSLLDSPAAGNTISEPVIWFNTGDATSLAQYYLFEGLVTDCGGLSGDLLAVCLRDTDKDGAGGSDFDQITNANHNIWFACQNPAYTLSWIDTTNIQDPSGANGGSNAYLTAGGDCGGVGVDGPVTMLIIVPRKNAYDIARPNTLMKVISAGTATIGTGTTVDPLAALFTFSDALPLVLARVMMPPNLSIYDGVTYQQNVRAFYTVRETFDNREGAAVSGLLRAFLEKSGAL
ncbi:MAG: hypothetical protein ABUK01_17050 [Leptospirales bacterium]